MKTLLPPVGFWSYARLDDDRSDNRRITRLHDRIESELQLSYGRDPVSIFQDTSGIAHGVAWANETIERIHESTFLIPIVTPNFIQSEWCIRETREFIAREEELTRLHPELRGQSRIFPIYYRPIRDRDAHDPELLDILNKRQRCDLNDVRDLGFANPRFKRKLRKLVEDIRDLLFLEVKGDGGVGRNEETEAKAEAEALALEAERQRLEREKAAEKERADKAAQARRETERREAEVKRREAEAAEAKRREAEAAEAKRREAEAAEAKRREAEAAEAKRREAEAAEAKRREAEEAEAKRREAEAAEAKRREAEEAEAKRREAEAAEAKRRVAEEAEAKRREAEEAEAKRREAEAAEAKRREAEKAARQAERHALIQAWFARIAPHALPIMVALLVMVAVVVLTVVALVGRSGTGSSSNDAAAAAIGDIETSTNAAAEAPDAGGVAAGPDIPWLFHAWGMDRDCNNRLIISRGEGNAIHVTAGEGAGSNRPIIGQPTADRVETAQAIYTLRPDGTMRTTAAGMENWVNIKCD